MKITLSVYNSVNRNSLMLTCDVKISKIDRDRDMIKSLLTVSYLDKCNFNNKEATTGIDPFDTLISLPFKGSIKSARKKVVRYFVKNELKGFVLADLTDFKWLNALGGIASKKSIQFCGRHWSFS